MPSYTEPSPQDNVACRWHLCDQVFCNYKTVYDHICEVHIGRKSRNDLTLVCQWDDCGKVVVKRNHITSHVLVHLPYKPHICALCGRSFKRCQDLKKHVAIHSKNLIQYTIVDVNSRYTSADGRPGQTCPLLDDKWLFPYKFNPSHHQDFVDGDFRFLDSMKTQVPCGFIDVRYTTLANSTHGTPTAPPNYEVLTPFLDDVFACSITYPFLHAPRDAHIYLPGSF